MRFESKLLGSKECYNAELATDVARYDLFYKKGERMLKVAKKFLKRRDRVWREASKVFAAYSHAMKTPGPKAAIGAVAPSITVVGEKMKQSDQVIHDKFVDQLKSLLLINRHIFGEIKNMEKRRRKMQEAARKAKSKGPAHAPAAAAALQKFDTSRSRTHDHLRKFLTDVDGFKTIAYGWIDTERACNLFCWQELVAVSTPPQKANVRTAASVMADPVSIATNSTRSTVGGSQMGSVRSSRGGQSQMGSVRSKMDSARSDRGKDKSEESSKSNESKRDKVKSQRGGESRKRSQPKKETSESKPVEGEASKDEEEEEGDSVKKEPE